jgi:hypothetical protein
MHKHDFRLVPVRPTGYKARCDCGKYLKMKPEKLAKLAKLAN